MKKLIILLLASISLFGQFKFQRCLPDRYTEIYIKGTERDINNVKDVLGNRTITASGVPAITTDFYKFGNSSLSFNASNGYWTFPNIKYTDKNFTIEFWYYCVANKNYTTWYSNNTSNAGGELSIGPTGYSNGTTYLYVSSSGNGWEIIGEITHTEITGSWVHYALTREGNVWKLFLNGSQAWTKTVSGTIFASASGQASLGYCSSTGFIPYGYIQNYKVSLGIARYTENFRVPNKP
ncbi:MAG: LamG-like jellyroll fold domain-containing protein [Actinomycetota bacterium]